VFDFTLNRSREGPKIINDCSERKAASSPYSNDLALTRIDYLDSFIHEALDEVTQKKFGALSRQPHCNFHGLEGLSWGRIQQQIGKTRRSICICGSVEILG
jgi:hypothetical protein